MARTKTAEIRAEKPVKGTRNRKTNNYPKNSADALEAQTGAIYLTVNISKPALNMRETPGGSIIGSVPKGAKVELIENTNVDWYKVKYQEKTGYCFAKHLKA